MFDVLIEFIFDDLKSFDVFFLVIIHETFFDTSVYEQEYADNITRW